LNDGQAFGELALMNKKPDKRNATIKTEEEVHLAYLDKDDFQKVILTLMERKLDQKVDFLKNFRISEGVNRVNLTKLSYFLQDKQFRRRDLLYK
jgi:CRP-like cAMP-binding protein